MIKDSHGKVARESFGGGSTDPRTCPTFKSVLDALEKTHDFEIEELRLQIRRLHDDGNVHNVLLGDGSDIPHTPTKKASNNNDIAHVALHASTAFLSPRVGTLDQPPVQPQSHPEPSWRDSVLASPQERSKESNVEARPPAKGIQDVISESSRGRVSTASSADGTPTDYPLFTSEMIGSNSFARIQQDFEMEPHDSKRNSGQPRNSLSASQAMQTYHSRATTQEDHERKKRALTTAQSRSGMKLGSIESIRSRIALSFRQRLREFIDSVQFEVFFASAIIVNVIFLGIEIDLRARNEISGEEAGLKVLDYAFTVLFAVELAVRLFAEGLLAYCDKEKCYWYYLDTFVVLTSVVEVAMGVFEHSTSGAFDIVGNARIFRVIRIFRIVKILRVARIVRFVRSLHTLVLSIVHTLRAVLWAFVFLIIIMYSFGMMFVTIIDEHIRSGDAFIPASLITFWGTVPRSMFTLYKSITNGVSWHDAVTPLADVHPTLVALFITYLSFTVFAVLNVITGVFCEAAMESARQDNDLMIHSYLMEKEKFTASIYSLFGVGDQLDEEISMSYTEFENVLLDPKTKAHLAAIQLDVDDAWELFKLLDSDESDVIDVSEFVNGCLRLKGSAKAIDVAKLSYETKIRQKRLMKQLHWIGQKVMKIHQHLQPHVSIVELSESKPFGSRVSNTPAVHSSYSSVIREII